MLEGREKATICEKRLTFGQNSTRGLEFRPIKAGDRSPLVTRDLNITTRKNKPRDEIEGFNQVFKELFMRDGHIQYCTQFNNMDV